MYHKNRYPTVEELSELAHLHRSTIEKYITLLLTIQDNYPFVRNPSLAEHTLKNLYTRINHG